MLRSRTRRRLHRNSSSKSWHLQNGQGAIRRLFAEALEKRILLTTVTSVDPLANSFTAPVSTNVAATFDQNINAGTATPQNFVVHSLVRAGAVSVSTSGATVTADPTTNFFPGEVVQVTATSAIQSATADPNVPRVWQFRTAVTAGSGIFADSGQNVGTTAARDVAFGDIDGDGDLDALESSAVDLVILRNDGSGVFTDTGQVINGNFYELEVGDLDGDNDLDVFGSTNVLLNDGNGNFSNTGQTLTGTGGQTAVVLGDMDGDGDLDALTGSRYSGARAWINNGSGVFSDSGQAVGSGTPEAMEFGDLDADGDLDLWVANYGSPNRVWVNNGSGVLTDTGQSLGGFGSGKDVDLGDVDGDGDLDAVVGNDTSGINAPSRLWVNNGSGLFTDSGQRLGVNERNWSVELGDLDADGDLDVFVSTLHNGSRAWINDGSGGFSDSGQSLVPATLETIHISLADVDGDGDLDAWEANNSQPSRVFLNQNLSPNVSLSLDSPTITENPGTATVTATLSAAHTEAVTIDLGISGTATVAEDYTISATQVVISAGSTTGSVTVTAIQDTVDDDDETVVIDIVGTTNAQEAGTQQVTITITDDDDPPTVTLVVDSANIAENGGVATFTATLSAVSGQDVTVDLGISGTATAGTDYNASGNQIVIAAGSTSGSVTVTAVNDAIDEPDETVDIDVTAVAGATEDGTQQATTTITDDDLPPTVSLAVDSANIAENGGIATFTATLSAASLTNTTVNLAVSGTAIDGTDYNISGTQIAILAGATSGSVTVTSLPDLLITEGPETVIVDIDSVTGNATEDGDQQATTTIVDDVNGPTVSIAVDNASIAEAGGIATVTATLASAFGLEVTIDLALTGTATAGTDYTASGTQIVVAVGATTGTITITGVDDALIEGDETVVVDVASVTNGTEDGVQQETITVTDDETPPTVALSVDNASIAEAGGVATVTATLSAASTLEVTVDLGIGGTATPADDYTTSGNQITIAAGSTTGSVTVTAVDDGSDDDDETIVVEITGATNATEDGNQEVTITIADDDDAPALPPGPTPPANSHTAPTSTVVGYTFDQAVTPGTATDRTFVVHSTQRGQLIGGATTVSASGPTIMHDPTKDFFAGELVQATVTSDVATTGGAAAAQVWEFRLASGGSAEFTESGQTLGDPALNTRSWDVVLGDVDGDGDLDAFMANLGVGYGQNGAPNRLYLNDGTGVFTDSGQSIGDHESRHPSFGDMDGDGDLDVVVPNDAGEGNRIWENDGSGVLTERQVFGGSNSEDLELADLDADGDLDVFVANNGQGNRVWRNDGGTLVDSGQSLGNHISGNVALGDLDNDGDIDAYVVNSNQNSRMWINDGNGRFTDSGQLMGFHFNESVALGDLDGDGDLDVWVANNDYASRVWNNNGSGVFTDSGQQLFLSYNTSRIEDVELGDLDGDGDLDAFGVNNNSQPNRIWENDGSGVFSDFGGASLDINTNSLGVALGDVNGDGSLDVVVANDAITPNSSSVGRVWLNRVLSPSVTISVDNTTIPEGGGVATFTASLPAAAAQTVTVNLGFSGTAGATDYAASGSQILIPSGATSGSITVTAVDDAQDEPNETVIVDITGVVGGTESGVQQATTTIADDDEPIPVPDVTLTLDNAAIPEAGGVATFTATLSEVTTVPVTVDLGISGTAAASDFNASGTQITVGPGATSGSITVTAVQDAVDESDETVVVDITSVTGGTEVGAQQQTTTITDDDEPVMPDVTLAVDNATIPEAGGVATFAVTLSTTTTVPVTVELGITGTAAAGDYSASGTQVVIAAGATTGSITVTAVDDTEDESNETVTIDVTAVTGGNEDGEQQQTTTITDDDDPPKLTVTGITATPSGFTAQFSTDLDTSVLNLYDTQTAGRGPADVVLQGALSGPVLGSLVVGPAVREVTFIKSGDPLAPDTYTVTLRSAADGFVDASGQLLDGNDDGTEGDNYTGEFVVDEPAANSVTIGIPDVVRGPGQEVNLPADATGIPVTISEGSNVRAVDLRVAYDPALLTITGGSVGADAPGGASVIVNTNTPGLAVVVFFSTNPLPAGAGTFVNLEASVPATDPSGIYGNQQVLDVHGVIVSDGNDNEAPTVVDDAVHLASFFADVSGNGRINAADASGVARHAALIDNGFSGAPNTDPLVVGDISGNGRLNAADASLLAQFAALIDVPQIPPIPGGVTVTWLPSTSLGTGGTNREESVRGGGSSQDLGVGNETVQDQDQDGKQNSASSWGLEVRLGSPLDPSHDHDRALLEQAIDELFATEFGLFR